MAEYIFSKSKFGVGCQFSEAITGAIILFHSFNTNYEKQ